MAMDGEITDCFDSDALMHGSRIDRCVDASLATQDIDADMYTGHCLDAWVHEWLLTEIEKECYNDVLMQGGRDAPDVAWMVGDEGGETLKKTMPMIKTMITTKMYDGKCDDNDDVYAMMTTTRMVCFFDLTSHGDRITIRGASH